MNSRSGLGRWWVAMIVPVALILAAPTAGAQQAQAESIVHAVGGSPIRGGDLSAAREEAINAGLVAAVHRVLSDLIPPETVTGNFQAINEAILTRTDRFVRDYRVIIQSTHANTFRTVVQATVSVNRLKDALTAAGIRLVERQYPRVLLCLAEKRVHDPTPHYWWSGRPVPDDAAAADTLKQALAAEGFFMVRPDGAAATGYPPELRGTEAVALGRQLDAEVVVVGLAMAEEVDRPGTQEAASFRGSITARAYRVADGAQIAQTRRAVLAAARDAYAGGNEALRNAAGAAAQDLATQIETAWFKETVGGTRIEMAVHGISGNIANFVRFRGALGNLSGVDRMQVREIMADSALMTVEYRGSSRALADALLLLGFDTFRISIGRLDADTIELQLMPR